MASFTSPVYWQEEVAGCGDADDFPAIPPFIPWTPSVTPPKVTPQVTPKGTLQSSPNQPKPHTPVLQGRPRGGATNLSKGQGRGLLPDIS